jgi:hypothetical protein
MATHISWDGTITEVHPADGKRFTRFEIGKLVGGSVNIVYVEFSGWGLVRVIPGDVMIVNGCCVKLRPDNRTATEIYRLQRQYDSQFDPVWGDALICRREEHYW